VKSIFQNIFHPKKVSYLFEPNSCYTFTRKEKGAALKPGEYLRQCREQNDMKQGELVTALYQWDPDLFDVWTQAPSASGREGSASQRCHQAHTNFNTYHLK